MSRSTYVAVVASRQRRPGVERHAAIDALPEPEAYAAGTEWTGAATDPTVDRHDRQSPAATRRPEDPPVRDPGVYAQTDHFRRRLAQQGRYVTLPIVAETIERGQLRWNRTDGWRFAHTVDGVRYVVVVTDTETASPVVVTGWTEIDDWETALDSDRFDADDVHTIQLRADLSEHRHDRIPGRIRPRIVSRPFEIAGHHVTTTPGDSSVVCTDCGGRFQSKDDLQETACSHDRAGR